MKSYFFVVLLQPFFKDNKQYGKIKNIGGDAGGIVLLLNRQEESSSPHWMDVDELCNYIPSHPVKQTVYGWVSDKQIPHHKINKALVFLQSEIDDWMKHCGNKSIEKQREYSQKSRTI